MVYSWNKTVDEGFYLDSRRLNYHLSCKIGGNTYYLYYALYSEVSSVKVREG